MMKTKLVSFILLLGSCSLGKAEPDQSLDPGDSEASNNRDLGWVVYASGRWTEASATEGPGQSVVQLGMKRIESPCPERRVCFDAPLVTELEHGVARSSLCPEALNLFRAQHAVGRFTGVIVRRNEKSTLVTSKHARGIRGYVALRSHDLANAQSWMNSESRVLAVPDQFVTKVKSGSRCDSKLDLMLGDLAGEQGGVELAEVDSVVPDLDVQAFIHPFGLPMKMAEATITKCDDESCWIDVEMGVGGSGSPVFTKEGKLAGILVGTGVVSRMGDAPTHDHQGNADLHPCCCSQACVGERAIGCSDICKSGQRFIKSSVIAAMIDDGSGAACGAGGWSRQ